MDIGRQCRNHLLRAEKCRARWFGRLPHGIRNRGISVADRHESSSYDKDGSYDKNEWKNVTYRAGQDINHFVDDAIRSGDYSSLSEQINRAVNHAVDAVHDSLLERDSRQSDRSFAQTPPEKSAYEQAQDQARTPAGRRDKYSFGKSEVYVKAGTFTSMAKTLGTVGLLFNLMILFNELFVRKQVGSGIVFLVISAMFYWLRHSADEKQKRVREAKRIVQIADGRDVLSMDEIASAFSMPKDQANREVQALIKSGILSGSVYLDKDGTTLMLSREAFQQYRKVMEEYHQREKKAGYAAKADGAVSAGTDASLDGHPLPEYARMKAQTEQRQASEKKLDAETQAMIAEGRAFIAHIRQKNEEIPGEEMSEKLDRLEKIVTGIFDQVARSPESAPDLHRLMSYYLPTTQKLVDTYAALDAQHVEGTNIDTAKREIENSLDTINDAYEKLFDSFFQHTAWDVGTDVSVMKSMLQQDGLTEDEFQKMRRQQQQSGELYETAADRKEEKPGEATVRAAAGAAQAYAEKQQKS